MKNGAPFGLGGIWENWKDPATGEWVRTFAIITTEANSLVAEGGLPQRLVNGLGQIEAGVNNAGPGLAAVAENERRGLNQSRTAGGKKGRLIRSPAVSPKCKREVRPTAQASCN